VDTAVVTGAGRGFGREVARLLAARGYAVLCTDIDLAAARDTADQLGEPAWASALDARDPAAHRAAAAAAAERGPLKVWINNAGVARAQKGFEGSDEEVRLLVETNLLGVMWGSRAAVEAMRSSGGHIVNIGSLSSLGPVPGLTTYAATKHGVLGFTTSLQGDLDLARIPIRAHAVCPDASATMMVTDVADEPDAAILFSGPRLLEPSEVAERIVALLDGKAIVLVIPRWRGWVARMAAPFPRAGLKVLALLRRQGDRKRRRERAQAPAAASD
jgi:NAD(P)-dependent dehydrogenase (short-subunit alcohol dehydrogenase family)